MKQIRLSKRLNTIAEMVTDGYRLADIGCDHAWLPVFLVSSGRIPSALAMDAAPGPLKRAGEHIREYHLQEQIEPRLSDGLEKLEPQEADTIVLSGMGGDLIIRILSAKPTLISRIPELILSPQSEVERVRSWLFQRGFVFLDEALVYEEDKWYFIMKVSAQPAQTGSFHREGTEREQMLFSAFGPVLLTRRDPALLAWLDWKESVLTGIRDRLKDSGRGDSAAVRLQEIEQQMEAIGQARIWMKSGV